MCVIGVIVKLMNWNNPLRGWWEVSLGVKFRIPFVIRIGV